MQPLSQKEAERKAAGLTCWRGPVTPEPLGGGISNVNFVVADRGAKFMVRIGDDMPVHGVLRRFELATSRAAHAAGVSPEVIHAEPGALVLRFIEGRTLSPENVRDPATLDRIVTLIQTYHRAIPQHLRGTPPLFWVFHAIRDYAARLQDDLSRMVGELPRLLDAAAELEQAVGSIELVFGHNDLLAANLIDDGTRLWLVDWEYGGFNSPLFDLANLAANNELSAEAETGLLDRYGATAPTTKLRRSYGAMKSASILREAMWSMVSEIRSALDFDYVAYTRANLDRFEQAYRAFRDR